MGVGYALDLVVCSALGVDQFDCVYVTESASNLVIHLHPSSAFGIRCPLPLPLGFFLFRTRFVRTARSVRYLPPCVGEVIDHETASLLPHV
jgi:hypothetical protein